MKGGDARRETIWHVGDAYPPSVLEVSRGRPLPAVSPVQGLTETYLPHLRPAQQRGVAEWVVGVLAAQSGCEQAVLAALEPLGLPPHATRARLREVLCDGADRAAPCGIGLEVEACFAPLLAWVLSWWVGETVPLALGTQTVGSVLRPAAYCGIVGFKPSYGRISTVGVVPLAWSLDHIGIFSRCVEDAALALSVLADADGAAPHANAVPVDDYLAALIDPPAPRIGFLRPLLERTTPGRYGHNAPVRFTLRGDAHEPHSLAADEGMSDLPHAPSVRIVPAERAAGCAYGDLI